MLFGAHGRFRDADTGFFRPVLFHLSYVSFYITADLGPSIIGTPPPIRTKPSGFGDWRLPKLTREVWSERRNSNPQSSRWQRDALPLRYARIYITTECLPGI